MNIKPLFQKRKTVIALILFIILSLPNTIFAMQAEPPFYYILIYGAGSEVTVSYTDNGALRQAEESKTAWETMYIIPGKEEYCQITIQAGSKTYSYKLDAFLGFHIDGYFIDVNSGTIIYSKPIIRSIILVTLRTGITFALGIGVLYLFGSRKRKTFLVYACTALMFLMPLNIFIDSSSGL